MTPDERADRYVGGKFRRGEGAEITLMRNAYRRGELDIFEAAKDAFCRVSCPAGCHMQKPFKCKRYIEFVIKLIEE